VNDDENKYYLGGQDCAWSTSEEVHVIEEDERCVLTEAGDVLCSDCGAAFLDSFPDEGQWERLDEVHEDWRVSR
jgi:hypothetical protein